MNEKTHKMIIILYIFALCLIMYVIAICFEFNIVPGGMYPYAKESFIKLWKRHQPRGFDLENLGYGGGHSFTEFSKEKQDIFNKLVSSLDRKWTVLPRAFS